MARALRTALKFGMGITTKVVTGLEQHLARVGTAAGALELPESFGLSLREPEVALLFAQGFGNREIRLDRSGEYPYGAASHRAECGSIMVLRESRILAVRSHAKLVAGGGYDARLMESQRQGYLGEPGGPEGRAA